VIERADFWTLMDLPTTSLMRRKNMLGKRTFSQDENKTRRAIDTNIELSDIKIILMLRKYGLAR
jgi:hypothetical protein